MNQDQNQTNQTIELQHSTEQTQRIIQLVQSWLDDESGYDEWAWPIIMQNIEENRLSYRRRFGAENAAD